MNIKNTRISKIYAKGLLQKCSNRTLHNFITDIHLCHTVLATSQELHTILLNPFIKKNKKKDLLKSIFNEKIGKDFMHFLFIICDHKRSNHINDILNETLNLAYKLTRIQKVIIESTIPLTQAQKKSLEEKLKELTEADQIQLESKINNELIGGIIVKTSSRIIDFSIKTQLQELSKLLMSTDQY